MCVITGLYTEDISIYIKMRLYLIHVTLSASMKISGRTNISGNVYINGKGIIFLFFKTRKIDVVHASSNIKRN